jgi:hypothetical protein
MSHSNFRSRRANASMQSVQVLPLIEVENWEAGEKPALPPQR